jgi:hypothetical protein
MNSPLFSDPRCSERLPSAGTGTQNAVAVAGYLDRVLGMTDGRLEEKTA